MDATVKIKDDCSAAIEAVADYYHSYSWILGSALFIT